MDLKLQAAQGTYRGADFRGEHRLGADTDPVDRHMTLAEVRIPDELADEALAEAETLNAALASFMDKYDLKFGEQIASAILHGAGAPFLAVRGYDND